VGQLGGNVRAQRCTESHPFIDRQGSILKEAVREPDLARTRCRADVCAKNSAIKIRAVRDHLTQRSVQLDQLTIG